VDYTFLNDWFFRQERVPSTYLDGYDYVYGTKEKVADALRYISQNIDFDLLAIVNSPGAALIGDNLLEIARSILGDRRSVMLESPGFSEPFELGYSEALRALLAQVGPALWRDGAGTAKGEGDAKSVNMLGLSIWHRYHEGDLKELRRLFDLCGIRVNACPCAGCTVEELSHLPQADLNVVLYPEMGLESARFLEETLGQPYYVCQVPPVGFAATERMFADICELLGVSDEAFMRESERARALSWYKIKQVDTLSGKPKGVMFHVSGNDSQVRAYTEFLTDYLGMVWADPEDAELVFADANLIAELMLKNKTFCGIEINLPGMGYIDLVSKTHLGIEGSLFLIEQVLNGLMSRL
jgi:nitrogenase molybdenum-iron protein alpha/beta subunit